MWQWHCTTLCIFAFDVTDFITVLLHSLLLPFFHFSSFQWANAIARRPSSVCLSVCLSVCPSVCKLFCANRFFYHRSGWIATKLAHDGPQMGPHPGCAQGQGQGQRSRDTGTSVMSRNVCYTVRSHVLSPHALTLWNAIYSPSSVSIRQLDV